MELAETTEVQMNWQMINTQATSSARLYQLFSPRSFWTAATVPRNSTSTLIIVNYAKPSRSAFSGPRSYQLDMLIWSSCCNIGFNIDDLWRFVFEVILPSLLFGFWEESQKRAWTKLLLRVWELFHSSREWHRQHVNDFVKDVSSLLHRNQPFKAQKAISWLILCSFIRKYTSTPWSLQMLY